MKIVFPCASSKNEIPFIYNEREINFVSHALPNIENKFFVHPDELIFNENISWRDFINKQENRKDLKKAYNLYKNEIYDRLYKRFGNNLFIFSAGWGIVRAEFKLPNYNITFSRGENIPNHCIRDKKQKYKDFNHLNGIEKNEKIIFIGPEDYATSFLKLVSKLPNEIEIFYRDKFLDNYNYKNTIKRISFKKYIKGTIRNWYYKCAEELINDDNLL